MDLTADRLVELAADDGSFAQDGENAVCITPCAGDVDELLVLTYAEAELYQSAVSMIESQGDDKNRLTSTTVTALERLGRLRRDNLERLARTEDVDVDLGELATRVRRGLAAHLNSDAAQIGAWDATTVKDLVEAYTGLAVLAERDVSEQKRQAENARLRLVGRAGVVVDVANELGAARFEGALEDLGSAIEQLAEGMDMSGPRARRAAALGARGES